MKKNKKRFIRLATCIGLSVALLSTAVFANLDNASGYSTFKKGIKNVIYSDNFSIDMDFTLDINGEDAVNASEKFKVDKNGEAKFSSESSHIENGENSGYCYKTVIQNGYRYFQYNYSSGNEDKYSYEDYGSDLSSLLVNKTESFDKGVNFVESITDALIGDIKNNFVLIDSNDKNKTYSIDMTGEQLPSYVSAGISLMCSGMRQNENNARIDSAVSTSDILDNMFRNEKEPFVEKVSGDVTFDESDNLTNFDGSVIIKGYNYDGTEITLNFNLNVNVYDYGTTTIEPVNPDEYEDHSRLVRGSVDEDTDYVITEDVDGVNASYTVTGNTDDGSEKTVSSYTIQPETGEIQSENIEIQIPIEIEIEDAAPIETVEGSNENDA